MQLALWALALSLRRICCVTSEKSPHLSEPLPSSGCGASWDTLGQAPVENIVGLRGCT